MFLIENGYFGCPQSLTFEKLLVIAFRDFKAFQCHTGQKCSQTKFVPRFEPGLHLAGIVVEHKASAECYLVLCLAKVWKPATHGAHMGHKGHNGKIIAYWLGDCMQKPVARSTEPHREICKWLLQSHAWPTDERLELIAVTMLLACFMPAAFTLSHPQKHNEPPIPFVIPASPRQSLCAWFQEVEKHGRYLQLACQI